MTRLRAIALLALVACEPTLPWDGAITLRAQGAVTGMYSAQKSASRRPVNLRKSVTTCSSALA